MLVTLNKVVEMHFRLLGTNGYHVKVNNKRFTAAGSRYRQNLKYENFTSSFGRLRRKIAPKACHTCRMIIFPHSANQIFGLWCWRCHRHFINYLLSNRTETSGDYGRALGIGWILSQFDHIWVFVVHAGSSTEVPVVLLSQSIVGFFVGSVKVVLWALGILLIAAIPFHLWPSTKGAWRKTAHAICVVRR